MATKKSVTITICASVAFYSRVLAIERELVNLGFKVLIPDTARRMQKSGNFDVMQHKTWYENPAEFKKKQRLMDAHFAKVKKAEAILVVNETKNGLPGYIGGNVLMEITAAYLLRKPIFVLTPVDKRLPIYEEILAVNPIFLNGSLTAISEFLKKADHGK